MHNDQVARLRLCVNEFTDKHGSTLTRQVEEHSSLVLQWLSYLNSYHRTGTADELLAAYSSAIRETSACLASRDDSPCTFCYENSNHGILAWIYFKDHPKEWHRINKTGEGFKLKKELFDYLSNYYAGFGTRYGILKQISKRKRKICIDFYRHIYIWLLKAIQFCQ